MDNFRGHPASNETRRRLRHSKNGGRRDDWLGRKRLQELKARSTWRYDVMSQGEAVRYQRWGLHKTLKPNAPHTANGRLPAEQEKGDRKPVVAPFAGVAAKRTPSLLRRRSTLRPLPSQYFFCASPAVARRRRERARLRSCAAPAIPVGRAFWPASTDWLPRGSQRRTPGS